MLVFVTWEVFLAGLLGVCLLLPVHEFSEVWCQELVVQCTAAVCQAVQQCRWVCQSLSGTSVLLSVHHCLDGDAAMVGTSPWPLTAGQGAGGVVWCPALWARRGAELQTELAEENAYLVRKFLPFRNKVILILFWSAACCFLSPCWLVALVLNICIVPGEIYEEWRGNKNIICLLDSLTLCRGRVFPRHSCICSWDCPFSYVAKCSVSWQAVLMMCACIWHSYTWGCSACHLLTLWVYSSVEDSIFLSYQCCNKGVFSVLSPSGKWQRFFRTGLAGGVFSLSLQG